MHAAGAGAAGAAGGNQFMALNNAQLAQLAQLMRGGATKLNRLTDATASAWLDHRRHFQKIVLLHGWDDQRQRRELAASLQEAAGKAVQGIDPEAAGQTIANLLNLYNARFMPQAAGATARSNYQAARQLPAESVREWHTRIRELFALAYPNDDIDNAPHSLDLFIAGLHNSNVRFFVQSTNIPDFTQALPIAERAETAHRDVTRSARGVSSITSPFSQLSLNAVSAPSTQMAAVGNKPACFFCKDAFRVSLPTKQRSLPWLPIPLSTLHMPHPPSVAAGAAEGAAGAGVAEEEGEEIQQ